MVKKIKNVKKRNEKMKKKLSFVLEIYDTSKEKIKENIFVSLDISDDVTLKDIALFIIGKIRADGYTSAGTTP